LRVEREREKMENEQSQRMNDALLTPPLRRGRPTVHSPEEKAKRWNDYIKNVYYPKHREECLQRRKEYYQKNKEKLNRQRVLNKARQRNQRKKIEHHHDDSS